MKKAIFAGSFDPFTNGHFDIIKKCALLFDYVYIVIGVNINKKRFVSAQVMKDAAQRQLATLGIDNCEVCIYDGLLVDFAKSHDVKYIVRGLRNSSDYEYEENMARVNKLLMPDIEYVYLRAENDALSSSVVRELIAFSADTGAFLPGEIQKAVTEALGK